MVVADLRNPETGEEWTISRSSLAAFDRYLKRCPQAEVVDKRVYGEAR